MSELLMECVEEELEPWQKQVPQINLTDDDDDDDEPIFVGVLSNSHKGSKPKSAPNKRNRAGNQMGKSLPPLRSLPATGPTPIVLPMNLPVSTLNTATTNLTTVTPRPLIVNNQGFIVTPPQLASNKELIASLGAQYPPGTSFTILPAGQQQVFQQASSPIGLPGVVHRPQVQHIRNNVVTLSNVQSPAAYSFSSGLSNQSNSQPLPLAPTLVKENGNYKVKRRFIPQDDGTVAKKLKTDSLPAKVTVKIQNGNVLITCPNCQEEISTEEGLKLHLMCCQKDKTPAAQNPNKLIMLVADFYYGSFEGDSKKKETQKTNTTFKCQSCLKVLKNNVRFMNHMKHHLELEKQTSESWESHTTCQHCYRQYMTPFQLQCHIESAHSPVDSPTNCKICELAFESEQLLLQHMKGHHKPGEMPYVCQVCNYRSSFFSDVENHFRSVHENTKDLLCPFCLKIIRAGHMYMLHYMKHQRKVIYRCGKCRLNFLTPKEKADHRAQLHRTFQKPKALDGLPPGTKVTIRASLSEKMRAASMALNRATLSVGSAQPGYSNLNVKTPRGVAKIKQNSLEAEKNKTFQKRKPSGSSTKLNLALKTLSGNGKRFTCIECNAKIDHFFSHFPMLSSCGACNYKTSCKSSIGNHMIKYHSSLPKRKFLKMDHFTKNSSTSKHRNSLVCLSCGFFVDGSRGDVMTKHLINKPDHECEVITAKGYTYKHRVKEHFQQPTKVQLLMTSPAIDKREINMIQTEVATSSSVTIVDQPELELEEPANEQLEDSSDASPAEGSSIVSSSLAAPASYKLDKVLDLCDKLPEDSENFNVQEHQPTDAPTDSVIETNLNEPD